MEQIQLIQYKIWNINSGQYLKIIHVVTEIFSLNKLSYTQIISCDEQKIQVWNIKTGKCTKIIDEILCSVFDV
jgi:hypothetical protein